MLDRDAHAALRLYAPRHSGGHLAGKDRVLGVILKISAAQRVPMNVHSRRQPYGDADLKHLFANGLPDLLQQCGVPALRQHGLAGPGGHIAIDWRSAADELFEKRLAFLEPAPAPILRQPVGIARHAVFVHGNLRHDVQPCRAVRQHDVGNALFEKCGTGAPRRAHHVVVSS